MQSIWLKGFGYAPHSEISEQSELISEADLLNYKYLKIELLNAKH